MKTTDCPVCRKSGALTETDPDDYENVKFQCELRACGTFSMNSWLLRADWPTGPLEDKEAIAFYLKMKNRKEPEDPKDRRLPRISKGIYPYYVSEGKRQLRTNVPA